jgi:hypothetical protein
MATPAYQGKLALASFPLGAAVNKIESPTLTLPSAQGRPIMRLHPTFPRGELIQLAPGPAPSFSSCPCT